VTEPWTLPCGEANARRVAEFFAASRNSELAKGSKPGRPILAGDPTKYRLVLAADEDDRPVWVVYPDGDLDEPKPRRAR